MTNEPTGFTLPGTYSHNLVKFAWRRNLVHAATNFYSDRSSAVIGDETLARLFTFPNVLITGHQAFFTKEALDNIALTTFANVKAYVAKETLVNEVK